MSSWGSIPPYLLIGSIILGWFDQTQASLALLVATLAFTLDEFHVRREQKRDRSNKRQGDWLA